MTTKQYLNQANALERRIQLLKIEIEKMRELSTSVSVKMDGERVQTSGDKDTMANAVATILEKEDVLAATIVLYEDSKDIIRRQIEGMENHMHSDVLYGRYIVGMTFYQIGLIIGKQHSQTFKIYSKAIDEFEKKYGHLYKKFPKVD